MNQSYLINAMKSYLKKTVDFLEKNSPLSKAPKIYKRRRGTVIIDTDKGILVVSSGKEQSFFLLPGGGAEYYESRKQAALRELQEETNLKAASVTYLFSYIGHPWQSKNSLKCNHHKVFLVKTTGIPQPTNEIKYIEYYKPGDQTKLSISTKEIIEKYWLYKQTVERI